MITMASITKDQITIAVICALPVEPEAVMLMFDERFDGLKDQACSDQNVYTCGRIGKHLLAVAILGAYGTVSACDVAKDTATSSPGLKVGLMVGIGGGIPSDRHDIRLGDVVVSQPQGKNPAVIQYQLGKIQHNGRFERVGYLDNPPEILLCGLNKLLSARDKVQQLMTHHIESARLNSGRKESKWHKPASDLLFHAQYEHHGDDGNTCNECRIDMATFRPTREVQYPHIHAGDAVYRDRIRDEVEALCFEMEAAGLMRSFPCLIIRGICDYADSHKNKVWQPYAAISAAALLKELLHVLPQQQLSTEQTAYQACLSEIQRMTNSLQHNFNKLGQSMQQTVTQRMTPVEQTIHDAQQQYIKTFRTSNYQESKDVVLERAIDTCQWVFQHDRYKSWIDSPSQSLLWITADPGCGEESSHEGLAPALCALPHQIFIKRPGLLRHAESLVHVGDTHAVQESGTLWTVLTNVLYENDLEKIYLVLDGLDECQQQDRTRLISWLVDLERGLRGRSISKVKLIVSSRPYHEIEYGFSRCLTISKIRLRGEDENEALNKEIDLVIRARVLYLADTLHLSKSAGNAILTRLLAMSHRTQCNSTNSEHQRRSRIMPTCSRKLTPPFHSVPLRSPYPHRSFAERLLIEYLIWTPKGLPPNSGSQKTAWFCNPRMEQLLRKVDLDLDLGDGRTIWGLAISKGWRWTPAFRSLSSGRGLKHEQNLVRLLEENIRRGNHLDCAGILKEMQKRGVPHHLEPGPIFTAIEMADRSILEMLLDYELRVNIPSNLDKRIELAVARGDVGILALILAKHERAKLPVNSVALAAAYLDSSSTLAMLEYTIKQGADPNFPCSMQSWHTLLDSGHQEDCSHYNNYDLVRPLAPALVAAVAAGHVPAICVLLSAGADPTVCDQDGTSILHVAVMKSTPDCLEILLEQSTNIEAISTRYGSVLAAASLGPQFGTFSTMLFEAGAITKASGTPCAREVYQAASSGNTEALVLFVDSRNFCLGECGSHGSPLNEAVARGHLNAVDYLTAVKFFLDKHDFICSRSRDGALYQITTRPRTQHSGEMISLLVDHGANITVIYTRGACLLHCVIDANHFDKAYFLQILLEYGVKVDTQGSKADTPLCQLTKQVASTPDNCRIDPGNLEADAARVLLAYGADPSRAELVILESSRRTDLQDSAFGKLILEAAERFRAARDGVARIPL
ncbi:hypothetical protein KVT40_007270 [Elsinoe batatas]|uniref:Nephrocystin 3-like N-terminal domain-containing protein n=1 Tax=Elsinoe batatas TaxID=2601811 RepID=A0A8K0KX15_9PEZI|nr:hypothetical protein KVT40_007270 [Elsinoe batatas]